MKIWFRRILALALISLGISMTFLPFNNTRSGSTETESVTIEQVGFIDLNEVKKKFPEMEIIDVTGPELNADDYPNLWDNLIDLVHYDTKNESRALLYQVFENVLISTRYIHQYLY